MPVCFVCRINIRKNFKGFAASLEPHTGLLVAMGHLRQKILGCILVNQKSLQGITYSGTLDFGVKADIHCTGCVVFFIHKEMANPFVVL